MEEILTGPGGNFSNAKSPEKILSLLYATGYRLTGDHRSAAGLVEGVTSEVFSGGNLQSALKALYREYVKKPERTRDKTVSPGRNVSGSQSDRQQLVQEVLLHLPPTERLVVVLRDVLGLTYAEIAGVIDIGEPGVARLLAAGRKMLRDRLIPRINQGNYSRRAGI